MASSDTCFNSVSLHLDSLIKKIHPSTFTIFVHLNFLRKKLRHLRTFYLFARKWGNDYDDAISSLGALLVEIEDAVSTIAQHIHHFCVSWKGSSSEIEGLCRLIKDADRNVDSFKEEINRWYVKFSDCPRQPISSCSSGDLVEFIDSILSNLNAANRDDDDYLQEDLIFLKNFIRLFTGLQGGGGGSDDDDDGHLGQNLLTHIKAQAASAAYHSYVKSKISKQQLLMIKLADPHVNQIYIQSLNDLKLSRRQPRSVVTLEIMQDFITSLLSYLFEILRATKIPAFSNTVQLQIFHQGLRSLRAILKKQPKNFDETMRDLTEDMVYDAGIVVFSLFRDAAIEVGFAQEMDQLLSNLLERITLIGAKVAEISPEEEGSFPKVDELGFFDSLLENLAELTSYEEEAAAGSAAIPKHQIQTIYDGLVLLRSFLGKIVQLRDEKEELRLMWNRAVQLAYKVEFLIDSSIVGDIPHDSSSQMSFDSITQEINIIELDALNISDNENFDATKRSNDFQPSERSVPIIKDEIIRLDDEARTIIARLKKRAKELQVVPIVGMPGLGKTILAKPVYNDSSITCDFHIRAWCCISQVYDKKNLLLQILTCISSDLSNKCEEDLALLLRQNLLRKKYLIVLDDLWNIDAWNILKDSFPDDKNGSRIILTSRFQDVALKEKFDGKPHFLRHLSDDESWKLLKSKLFPIGDWPPALHELGMQIVKTCKGLPLTIVIFVGILSSVEQGDWRDIVEHCLSSSSGPILQQCNNILELSYKCLPDKLKPCFLYFGAFPEDQEHRVDELTWLWIAEGFVCKEQSKSSEDKAKSYLFYLISRSLVMVDKWSSIGEVKTCRIHDLLYAFCVEKANRENFYQLLKGYDEVYDFKKTKNIRRLCIYTKREHLKKPELFCPRLRSH